MRKCFFTKRLRVLLLMIVLACIVLRTGSMFGDTVALSGGTITAASFNDTDITLSGENSLQRALTINAENRDVTISIKESDTVLQASTHGVETPLYLTAQAYRKITFEVEHDLIFKGGSFPLLIIFSGDGNLEFKIKGGARVAFESARSNITTPGAYFLVHMNALKAAQTVFTRSQDDKDTGQKDVEVVVGHNSLITFIGATALASGLASEEGLITFDPSNTEQGRMVVRIKDRGAFIIGAHKVKTSKEPLLRDIDFTTSAGSSSEVMVINSQHKAQASAGLLVINENKHLSSYQSDPFAMRDFNGQRFGFILSANGILNIDNNAYVDYIGTTLNQVPHIKIADSLQHMVKLRNPSAFIVDGFDNEFASPAQIRFAGSAALYFRSGCDKFGMVQERAPGVTTAETRAPFFFAIDSSKKTEGPGNVVLDVEGPLTVIGESNGSSSINILSLLVKPSGGTTTLSDTTSLFPRRTFATDATGNALTYNSAYFLINNRVNLFNTVLRHDDVTHTIYEKNFPSESEPTYVGGERSYLPTLHYLAQPQIALYNAQIHLHTSAAFSGVDIIVPNLVLPNGPESNKSKIVFFHNGRVIDRGTGRQLILGTAIDGTKVGNHYPSIVRRTFREAGCQRCTPGEVNVSTQLEVQQEVEQPDVTTHELAFTVASNNHMIHPALDTTATQDFVQQSAIHTIYQAHCSNISLGTHAPDRLPFELVTFPELRLAGNYFSFETQGGPLRQAERSATSGWGGIYVDKNGTVTIDANKRANISTMVVKGNNGVIDLPKEKVFFDTRVGIAHWQLNLNDPEQRVIIDEFENIADYTLDWLDITKDFGVSQTTFVPFEPRQEVGIVEDEKTDLCHCALITPENLIGLPEIKGKVGQLQIKRSRLGDRAHVLINGGHVRELVHLSGFDSAEAPVSVIVLKNGGTVGLGTAHRDADSTEAYVALGASGVSLIADGNGIVELNSNIVVNDVCHIVAGPHFGPESDEQRMIIRSSVMRELRVKSDGVLDLSSFTRPTQILEFTGKARLTLEPGARIILGGGTLLFNGESQLILVPDHAVEQHLGSTVTSTDDIRAHISGEGTLILSSGAKLSVPRHTYLGIETMPQCKNITNLKFVLRDHARFEIDGGSFQVGNTQLIQGRNATNPQTIRFELVLENSETMFEIKQQSFVGLGAGIIDKYSTIPNEWRIGALCDVEQVGITVSAGTLKHNSIASGDSSEGSLLVIGPVKRYSDSAAEYSTIRGTRLGGGNILCIPAEAQCIQPEIKNNAGTSTFYDPIVGENITVLTGILASGPLLHDGKKRAVKSVCVQYGTPEAYFNFIKTDSVKGQMQSPKTNIAPNKAHGACIAYVRGTHIIRQCIGRMIGGITADEVHPDQSCKSGAAALVLGAHGAISSIIALSA